VEKLPVTASSPSVPESFVDKVKDFVGIPHESPSVKQATQSIGSLYPSITATASLGSQAGQNSESFMDKLKDAVGIQHDLPASQTSHSVRSALTDATSKMSSVTESARGSAASLQAGASQHAESFIDKLKDVIGIQHESAPALSGTESVKSLIPTVGSHVTDTLKNNIGTATQSVKSAVESGASRASECTSQGKVSVGSVTNSLQSILPSVTESQEEGVLEKLKHMAGFGEPSHPVVAPQVEIHLSPEDESLVERFKHAVGLGHSSFPTTTSSMDPGRAYDTLTSGAQSFTQSVKSGAQAPKESASSAAGRVTGGVKGAVQYATDSAYPSVTSVASVGTQQAKAGIDYGTDTVYPSLSSVASVATNYAKDAAHVISDTAYPSVTSVASLVSESARSGMDYASETAYPSVTSGASVASEFAKNTAYPSVTSVASRVSGTGKRAADYATEDAKAASDYMTRVAYPSVSSLAASLTEQGREGANIVSESIYPTVSESVGAAAGSVRDMMSDVSSQSLPKSGHSSFLSERDASTASPATSGLLGRVRSLVGLSPSSSVSATVTVTFASPMETGSAPLTFSSTTSQGIDDSIQFDQFKNMLGGQGSRKDEF
jgi:hypothetical protein